MRVTKVRYVDVDHIKDLANSMRILTKTNLSKFMKKYNSNTVVWLQVNNVVDKYRKLLKLDEVDKSMEQVDSIAKKLRESLTEFEELKTRNDLKATELTGKEPQLQHAYNTFASFNPNFSDKEQNHLLTELNQNQSNLATKLTHVTNAKDSLYSSYQKAVLELHEVRHTQANHSKLVFIVLTAITSFLSFLYYTLRKTDMKQFIDERFERMEAKLKASQREQQANSSWGCVIASTGNYCILGVYRTLQYCGVTNYERQKSVLVSVGSYVGKGCYNGLKSCGGLLGYGKQEETKRGNTSYSAYLKTWSPFGK